MVETNERAKRHIDRWGKLRGARGPWENHWEDLARVMLPRRMGFTSSQIPGSRRTEDIYDGAGMLASRGLANAIGGLLRPDGQEWFFLKPSDDNLDLDDEAIAWIHDAEERMREAFADPRARFRQATGEADQDLVVFGTAVLFESESPNLGSLFFSALHLKDAYPYLDAEGKPSGMYRSRRLAVRQAVEKFGLGNVSEETRELYRKEKYETEIEFLHCVVPRMNGVPGAQFAVNMKFADLWIEVKTLTIVKEGGFPEFPFVVPRWDTSSGEEYGRSPGMIALPDVNTLQAMGETMLVAGQRAADPPLGAPADGSFHEINTYPGGLAYYDPDTVAKIGRNPFFPIETGSNMPLSREMQLDMRNQVFNAFLRNVLNLPVDGPTMTATEVIERKEEFLREIGPVFGRLETDYTAPMVEMAFKIMLRANAFAPIPESLAGAKVKFEYESPVKRIRQQVEAKSAQIWVADAMVAAEAKPEALDVVNFEEYLRFGAEAMNLPSQIINGRDHIEELREQRKRDAEEAKKMAMIQQVAQAAQQGGAAAGSVAGGLDKLAQANQRAVETQQAQVPVGGEV